MENLNLWWLKNFMNNKKYRALLVHDHKFIIYQDQVYSKGNFSYEILKRYLNYFNDLHIFSRKQILDQSIDIKSLKSSQGNGIHFTFAPSISSPISRLKNISFVRDQLVGALKETDYLIVRLPSELGLLAISVAKRLNKPFLIELVGDPYLAVRLHGNKLGIPYAPILKKKIKTIMRESPFSIYVSKNLHDLYPTRGEYEFISNVNIGETNIDVVERRLKKKVNKKAIIGMIASIDNKYKNVKKLVELAGLLKENSINAKIEVVGDGDILYWKSIVSKERLNDYLFFVGPLKSGKAIFDWLDNVDIYVQTSLTEGLPRSVIEAMSRGCPVVSSNVGGIPELIDEEYLFDPQDTSRLYYKVVDLLENNLEREQTIIKNYEEAKKYNKKILDGKRDAFFNKFIGSKF
ncbi:glycosyltransferase [Bhargavaea ginsengi]|uniref:glycosyltransferase n=1 Tax=Bhargavaea ginsengi TaxID=426757 RepID=UPI003C7914A7